MIPISTPSQPHFTSSFNPPTSGLHLTPSFETPYRHNPEIQILYPHPGPHGTHFHSHNSQPSFLLLFNPRTTSSTHGPPFQPTDRITTPLSRHPLHNFSQNKHTSDLLHQLTFQGNPHNQHNKLYLPSIVTHVCSC
jgi:hypothetical protein